MILDQVEVDGKMLAALSPTGQLFHETFRYRFQRDKAGFLPPESGIRPGKKKASYEDSNHGKHRG
jgi:hypothetical protein